MHAAVQTDNLDILKQLVNKITDDKTGTEKPSTEKAKNMRIKTLLCTPDKMQREPLHIAAYKVRTASRNRHARRLRGDFGLCASLIANCAYAATYSAPD